MIDESHSIPSLEIKSGLEAVFDLLYTLTSVVCGFAACKKAR